MRRTLRTALLTMGLSVALVTGVTTAYGTGQGAPAADTAPAADDRLDRAELRASLEAIHEAGMYGVYSTVREGDQRWSGASGVADRDTGRAVRPDMRHRVGSVTKTFVAVGVLQQVERGRIDLDAPVGDYLPELVPGERGRRITVRMLLNHTSGIADYVPLAFPSLLEGSTDSLDDNRFRRFSARELIELGLQAPPTAEPGAGLSRYSNTNYLLAGELLREVTGMDAERYLTRHVIRRAGLRDTAFPRSPRLPAPHARMYESYYGLIDPPRDYSVYDMSWAGTAGALVSTTDDLSRFYRALLGGELLGEEELAEMKRTVPSEMGVRYGLGLYALDLPCGTVWGHDGAVWGAGTYALATEDGQRQMTLGMNLMKYQELSEDGTEVLPHPIDYALSDYLSTALCGATPSVRGDSAELARKLPSLPGSGGQPVAVASRR